MSNSTNQSDSNGWFMYHGGYHHGGFVNSGSEINSDTVKSNFGLIKSIITEGSILSVPAVTGGYIFVGTANSYEAKGSNGGSIYKINIESGETEHKYTWDIDVDERDAHGFTGMGCTPTVLNDLVYFVGFNAVLYCLKSADLSLVWKTDLRNEDLPNNQPVTNTAGTKSDTGTPPNPNAAGWSSPVVVNFTENGSTFSRVYLGIGEGENPELYSFIFCLDGNSGKVEWIYCTNLYVDNQPNKVNDLPGDVLLSTIPSGYTANDTPVITKGCSVWSAIAYDADTGNIYASTGNPAPDGALPTKGFSNGILALNAKTGDFAGFQQMPAETAYRKSDIDVDIGSSCTIFTREGQKVVAVPCKNGGFMVCDAESLALLSYTQLLPHTKDGQQIPQIDPHPPANQTNVIFPQVSNETSNKNTGENYFGPFNTAAIHLPSKKVFLGMGGPNYHNQAPGIDSDSTPFMKVIDWNSLEDAWPLDDKFDPPRYANVGESMYTTAGEAGLSSPAVVNDVVFITTSKIAIYAFNVNDGSLLWSNRFGDQTLGYNGGYGYCLGPAISGNYVVAGGLILGQSGGVLNIYGIKNNETA